MTGQQISRVKKEWSEIAGEQIRAEEIGGCLYAFGSELGMLRLEHKMRMGRAAYSDNLKTWSYCTERGDRSTPWHEHRMITVDPGSDERLCACGYRTGAPEL